MLFRSYLRRAGDGLDDPGRVGVSVLAAHRDYVRVRYPSNEERCLRPIGALLDALLRISGAPYCLPADGHKLVADVKVIAERRKRSLVPAGDPAREALRALTASFVISIGITLPD